MYDQTLLRAGVDNWNLSVKFHTPIRISQSLPWKFDARVMPSPNVHFLVF